MPSTTRCHPFLWLVAPMLVLIAGRYFFAPTDVDYWWHVRTGQLIAETGALPRADVFSYTSYGHPWVTHEWLTQVVFYAIQHSVGYVGNVVLWGVLGAASWFTVFCTARLRGLGEPGAIILAVWGSAMAFSITAVRPQVITALLLAVTALLITRHKLGERRALWILPPMFALWVNLHGGYVIGLILLGLALVGETTSRIFRGQSAPLKPLFVISVLSGLATLLSPNGLGALWYPFTYAGSGNASMRLISEWQSPDFHESGFLVFGASLVLALILGIGRRPLGPTEILWTALFSVMALSSLRHIPLYAIVVTPLIAARLATEVPWLGRPLSQWRRPALVTVAWPLLLATLVTLLARSEVRGGPQLSAEPSAVDYPTGAVEMLRDSSLRGPIFNEYHWGGYLIYALDRPVFIDGRADVHGDEMMDRYVKVARLQPGWRDVLSTYGVNLMLIQKDAPLDVALATDPEWQALYTGTVERLYQRANPLSSNTIDASR